MRIIRLMLLTVLLAAAGTMIGCDGEPRCKCGTSGNGMDCDPCPEG